MGIRESRDSGTKKRAFIKKYVLVAVIWLSASIITTNRNASHVLCEIIIDSYLLISRVMTVRVGFSAEFRILFE